MSPSSRPFCISAVLRNTVLAVLRTIESASADKSPTALSISSSVARGLPRVRGFTASRTRSACKYASYFGPDSSSGGTSAAGSFAYAIAQYSAKNPAARLTLQNTIVPAIGWILSANEIKLVTPAMISESRQTVTSTARAMIIFLALEFWAAAAAFTIRCRYCAPGTADFNRNVERAEMKVLRADWAQKLRAKAGAQSNGSSATSAVE